jgi:hypothetical protein
MRQAIGFSPDSLACFGDKFDLLLEREDLASFCLVGRLDPLREILDSFAQWIEHHRRGLLPSLAASSCAENSAAAACPRVTG